MIDKILNIFQSKNKEINGIKFHKLFSEPFIFLQISEYQLIQKQNFKYCISNIFFNAMDSKLFWITREFIEKYEM